MAQQMGEVVVSRGQVRTWTSRWAETWKLIKANRAAYLFTAPFLILFFTFTVLPVFAGVYLSFTYFNVLQPPKWIGWTNYRLLFLEDDIFLTAIKNTIIFSVITGPVGFILSFILAWLINQLKYRIVYTLAFYAPSITTATAMAVIWRYFFSGDQYGFLNYLLIRLGILAQPFQWLQDIDSILPVIMIVALWMSMGAGFLVFLAGLQNVDTQLYEAGKVDGIKNRWQEVYYITLPLMKPQLLFGAVMAVVRSFEVGDISTSLAGFPSPLYAGHTILVHLMDYAFIRFEMGYAAAISVFLFCVMFGLSRLFMKVFSTRGEY
ncbi:MAG TPA: sugar ABC transporter permease [Limnochordia bacterium]